MRSLPGVLLLCLVLPLIFFVMSALPVLNQEMEKRLPLLTVYFLSRQLEAEIARADSASRGLPPSYGAIIAEYGSLSADERLTEMAALSGSTRKHHATEAIMARWILWRNNLPYSFLAADPVKEIRENLQALRLKESRSARERDRILAGLTLQYLKVEPPSSEPALPVRHTLPDRVAKTGLVFCGEKVPLERPDVRRRVESQIYYLVTDFRETTLVWLKRKDRYSRLISEIVKKEELPEEFALLPALESGYNASVVSPSLARGWWQFVKGTAVSCLSRDPDLDWTLKVERYRDERCDLSLSTRSAARYLKWMRSRLSGPLGPASWLTVAAAYNAGLSEIQYRMGAYRSITYWDMKLPLETEDYVPRWIALSIIDANRKYYRLEVPAIVPVQYDTIEGVRLTRDLPIALLAALTQSSLRFIAEINGSLQDGATVFKAFANNAEVTQTINVPVNCKEAVLKALTDRAYLKGGPLAQAGWQFRKGQ